MEKTEDAVCLYQTGCAKDGKCSVSSTEKVLRRLDAQVLSLGRFTDARRRGGDTETRAALFGMYLTGLLTSACGLLRQSSIAYERSDEYTAIIFLSDFMGPKVLQFWCVTS